MNFLAIFGHFWGRKPIYVVKSAILIAWAFLLIFLYAIDMDKIACLEPFLAL